MITKKMFKRSHILLSRYLADEMNIKEIKEHTASLSIGSVLPDLSFRQRVKDHEFTRTWDDTKKRILDIEAFTSEERDKHSERALCRQIGMVLHYLADYFTCPHNPSYRINIIKHSFYEGRQAYHIRGYLKSPEAREKFISQKNLAEKVKDTEGLFSYIEDLHGLYLQDSSHTPKNDCEWVLDVCAFTAVVLTSAVYGCSAD